MFEDFGNVENGSIAWLVDGRSLVAQKMVASDMAAGFGLIEVGGVAVDTSEKDSTCISPFVHPNVHVITCSSFMWPEMHASTEAFTLFLYIRTPLVTASHNLFPRGQKVALTSLLIHAN
jgi:hypothetical protein